MILTIIIGIYCTIGGLLTGALLTDKNVNTNKLEAVFCFIAGTLWPLAIGIAAGFGLFENIRDRRLVKRRIRNDLITRFSGKLYKLQLISRDTLFEVQKRLT